MLMAKMKLMTMTVLAIVVTLYAIGETSAVYGEEQMETRVYNIKFKDARELMKILASKFEGRFLVDDKANAIIVTSEPSNLKAMEKLIKKTDADFLPPRQIEVQIKMILASREETEPEISPGIENIGKQLQKLFKFTRYELIDMVTIRGEDRGKSQVNSEGRYKIDIEPRLMGKDLGIIRLRIKLWKNVPPPVNFQTILNIKNGGTVIIGGSTVASVDRALIIAVSARTLDAEM